MSKPRDYDKIHLQNLSVIKRKIESIFKKAAEEAAKIGVSIRQPLKDNRIFSFDDYPETQKHVDKLLKSLHESMEITIVNGVRSSWTLSNNKNSALASRVFGKHVKDLSKEQYRRYFSTNGAALDAFLKRKEKGLNLSDRVWKYTGAFKNEIELGLDLGIRSGESAAKMTRSLTQYLQYPDKLFRRVRDEHGILQLSKAAKAFHPGTGVYRSSYKNALRLAATETNIAYRTSDYLRWQQMDFVVGIEIRMSNNHPIEDICDELAGRYPKDFKFTGWHPFCRCHVVPVLKTEEEMDKDTQRILDGKEPLPGSINGVKDVPSAFGEWITNNSERIKAAEAKGTVPYFITDNPKYTDPNLKARKAVDTAIKPQTEHVPLEVISQYGMDSLKPLSDEAKLNSIIDMTGVTKEEAARYLDAVKSFSHGWDYEIREYQRTGNVQSLKNGHTIEEVKAKAKTLEEFLSKSPQWVAPAYRGIGVTEEEYNAILSQLKNGTFDMRGAASWTSEIKDAKRYAYDSRWDKPRLVVFECESNGRATSIRHLSIHPDENEVLVSNGTKYRIIGEPIEDKIYGRTPVMRIKVEAIDGVLAQVPQKKTPLHIVDEHHTHKVSLNHKGTVGNIIADEYLGQRYVDKGKDYIISKRFAGLRTHDEVASTLSDYLGKRLGRDVDIIVAPEFIDLKTAKAYATEIERLSRQYKLRQGRLMSIRLGYHTPDPNEYGMVHYNPKESDKKTLYLNKAFDIKYSDKAIKSSRCDDKYLERATATHEFGHLLYQFRDIVPGQDILFESKVQEVYDNYRKEVNSLIRKRDMDKLAELYLGNYADTGIGEFLAEAFQEYKNCRHPSKYATEIGNLIDRWFKR